MRLSDVQALKHTVNSLIRILKASPWLFRILQLVTERGETGFA